MAEHKQNELLRLEDLTVHFPIRKGFLQRRTGTVQAVSAVNLSMNEGEVLGLVGESGCGKTTTGRSIVRIIKPTAGKILYTEIGGSVVDLAHMSDAQLLKYRGEIRMVFQDPFSSLNPRLTVGDIIGEVLEIQGMPLRERRERVAYLLEKVGLRPEYSSRFPHAFSGGERQRIGIARALATNPRLVVADESVSALDVSIQAQTINLLQDLQDEFNLTYLFVAHDLSVVEHISDRVAVMYVGKVVEVADKDSLFGSPKHPYTEALLHSVPRPVPRKEKKVTRRLSGEVADPANPPQGCYFHPRCPYAQAKCRSEEPALQTLPGGHQVACHFAEELQLEGIPAVE
jgi:peptide/nickel transport system ATP-binding protein